MPNFPMKTVYDQQGSIIIINPDVAGIASSHTFYFMAIFMAGLL